MEESFDIYGARSVAIVIVFIELVSALLTKAVSHLYARLTRKEAAIQAEVEALRREAQKYDTPSTFVECAKLQREANQREKDLTTEKSRNKKRIPFVMRRPQIFDYVVRFVLTVWLCYYHWHTPVAYLQPLTSLFPFGTWMCIPICSTYRSLAAIHIVQFVSLFYVSKSYAQGLFAELKALGISTSSWPRALKRPAQAAGAEAHAKTE